MTKICAPPPARAALTPARLGIIYRPAGLMRFVHVIGLPATKELFYTARKVSARRAVDLRLVKRVCPPEELEQRNLPLSIRGTKDPRHVHGAILIDIFIFFMIDIQLQQNSV